MARLPSMSWYLRPLPSSWKRAALLKEVVEDINIKLDRTAIEAWKHNLLERPASTFFPVEMNCDSPTNETKNLQTARLQNRTFPKILLVEHPSGESKIFSNDVRKALETVGYTVTLTSEDNDASATPNDHLTFAITRQFLGDSVLNVLNLVLHTFKLLPDPNRELSRRLSSLEKSEKSAETNQDLKSLCQKFYHHFHIPLAHRRYAFLYKDPALANLFSKGNGNFLIGQLVDYLNQEP